jgi:hypothetical protein
MPIDPDVQPLLDAITQRQTATDGAIQNILDAIRTMQATDATQHSTLTTLNGVLTTLSSQVTALTARVDKLSGTSVHL